MRPQKARPQKVIDIITSKTLKEKVDVTMRPSKVNSFITTTDTYQTQLVNFLNSKRFKYNKHPDSKHTSKTSLSTTSSSISRSDFIEKRSVGENEESIKVFTLDDLFNQTDIDISESSEITTISNSVPMGGDQSNYTSRSTSPSLIIDESPNTSNATEDPVKNTLLDSKRKESVLNMTCLKGVVVGLNSVDDNMISILVNQLSIDHAFCDFLAQYHHQLAPFKELEDLRVQINKQSELLVNASNEFSNFQKNTNSFLKDYILTQHRLSKLMRDSIMSQQRISK